jgi:DNA-binding beta-propeller fold protein YncE
MRYCQISLLAMTLALAACGPASPPEILVPDTPAICQEGPALTSLEVSPQIQPIAEQANHMIDANGWIWVLESGANTVSRYNPSSGVFEAAFVDLGNDRGPYDLFIDGARGFATNYLANTVSVFDTNSGEVLAELDDPRLVDPSGIAATRAHLYVTNVEFLGVNRGWGRGSIVVIERDSLEIVGVIPARAKNPQYVTVLDAGSDSEPGKIAIVSTGELGQVDGRYVQTSLAAVEIWTETEDPLAPAKKVFELPSPEPGSRVGAPGRALVSPDGASLYMTSATAPVVFSIDLEQLVWVHGADSPIVLYEEDSDTLHSGVLDRDGLLWITSFNQDAVYVLDTSCDELLAGPIPVGIVDDELEGPIAVVSSSSSSRSQQDVVQPDVYFITSLSKQLGRIEGM